MTVYHFPHLLIRFLGLAYVSFFLGCNGQTTTPDQPVATTPAINYAVIKTYPHDNSLYTEGLVIHNGQLFESTGSPEDIPQTRSMIGITDLNTGVFTTKTALDRNRYFGEGIVFLNNKIYQLTYHNNTGFIYNANTFQRIDSFTYTNKEGWGLTTDSIHLIMSDGTAHLTFLDTATLKPVKKLQVMENDLPLAEVNELEYIRGYIYGNVWKTNYIVKIDPVTGNVVGKIDLGSLTAEARSRNPQIDVLNGIAYDPINDRVLVTGKMWANVYEISFAH